MAAPVRGKVTGTALGLVVGGPVGAAVGLAVGHAVDHVRGRDARALGADELRGAFAERLLTLLVDVARADGPVGGREVAAIRAVFLERMRLTEAEAATLRRRLSEEVASPRRAEEAAAWIRARLGPDQCLRVLEALREVARTDGPVGAGVERRLQELAGALGVDAPELAEAYDRLRLPLGASPAEVRRAFRSLAARHHPDRAVRHGPEAVARAQEVFFPLREAYERIRAARGGW